MSQKYESLIGDTIIKADDEVMGKEGYQPRNWTPIESFAPGAVGLKVSDYDYHLLRRPLKTYVLLKPTTHISKEDQICESSNTEDTTAWVTTPSRYIGKLAGSLNRFTFRREVKYTGFDLEQCLAAVNKINTIAPNTASDAKEAAGVIKPQLHMIPPAAQEEEAKALEHGAIKYGERNWIQGEGIKINPYLSAMKRHIDALLDGEDIDPDSGAHHLGHIRAGAGILLDARKHDKLIDDRFIHLKKS